MFSERAKLRSNSDTVLVSSQAARQDLAGAVAARRLEKKCSMPGEKDFRNLLLPCTATQPHKYRLQTRLSNHKWHARQQKQWEQRNGTTDAEQKRTPCRQLASRTTSDDLVDQTMGELVGEPRREFLCKKSHRNARLAMSSKLNMTSTSMLADP